MDENAAGATITAVSTENATETTVDNDHFEVADGNLKLKADSSLDFEAVEGGMLDVTITASGDGESATHTVTITVNDVNEAPMIAVADGETPDGMPASSTVDENVQGAILGAITLSDPDAGQMHTLTTSDDRFVTKQDAEGGWWLALADGVSLDHEAGATVMVTVTVTDDGDPAMSASTDVTITVNDVNEAPTVTGTVDAITGQSGKDLDPDPIDLLALFSDQDEGDAPVRYEMSGNPSWLKFRVEYGEDDDGNDTAHGIVSGEAPTTGADSDAAHKVTLTATDGDGEEAPTSFYVIIDDGNDDIESIDLYHNPDGDGNEARNIDYAVEVDENDDSGVVFGRIKVEDPDHEMHPNGMHDVTVNNPNFEIRVDAEGGLWLALKEGKSLNYEGRSSLDITITATDGPENRMGERTQNPTSQTVTVFINDKNDAPTANDVGDWWVTVNRELRASDVSKGQLVKFELESQAKADARPAFEDQDIERGGDALSYSISGVNWLEIDAESGLIQNVAGMMPQPGKYRVTVTATDMGDNRNEDEDTDGQSASVQFMVIVAESRPNEDGVLIADNDDPVFTSDQTFDYTEGSGRVRVATFTIRDDDLNLDPHPFGKVGARIDSAVKAIGDGDREDYSAVFELSDPRPAGNNIVRYDIFARDDPKTKDVNELEWLNHEAVREIEITVVAHDGVGVEDDGNGGTTPTIDATRDGIRVRITDRQEAPMFGTDADTSTTLNSDMRGTFVTVGQEGDETVTLYLNLSALWSDPEEDDLSGKDRFTVTSNVDWAKVTVGPAEWRDIDEVRQQDGTTAPREWLLSGTDDDPESTDVVAIVVIDRTAAKGDNTQSKGGAISLTARDASRTGEGAIQIRVTDDNLNISGADTTDDDPGVVSIRGVARQGSELQAIFDHTKDPDLASGASPALVIYTWNSFEVDEDGAVTGGATLLQSGLSDRLMLTDAHAGRKIQVSVKYYEAFDDPSGDTHNFVAGNDDTAVTHTTPEVVRDRNDAGSVTFNLLTSGTVVNANAVITDPDGVDTTADSEPDDDPGKPPTYTWEESDNGRGGWTPVDADEPDDDKDDTSDQALDIADFFAKDDADGKFLRVVVEYTDTSGFSERHASDPIQFGALKNPTATQAASITGTLAVGGTLIVDSGGGSVQWQRDADRTDGENWVDIPGATGNLQVTSNHQGMTLRAVVTYTDDDGNVTARVAVTGADTSGDGTVNAPAITIPTGGNSAPVPVDDYEIRAQVGEVTTHTVPLASLFQDADGDHLSFTITGVTALGGDTVADVIGGRDGGFYAYTGAEQIATFNARTGMLTHRSDPDKVSGHDGTPDADGGGNILKFMVTATDGGGTSGAAEIGLRINVAPTAINFTDAEGGAVTENTVNVDETAAGVPAPRTPTIVARLNVQDENETDDSFGTHTVTVDDDRFEVVQGTYNPATRTGERADQDGSTLMLVLKAGEALNFEAENADGKPTITLTLTATDGGGLSTPTRPTIQITVEVMDVPDKDDPTEFPDGNKVPGLKDNEADDTDDTTDDGDNGDADNDTDGGIVPPPPGMSIGLIEDFTDNMDFGEIDLLEDYLLTIDDGLDIV